MDAQGVHFGRLTCRYDDSVQSFVPPPDAHWRFVAPGKHEVIRHNDWSPSNALFRGHLPVVMLDWDSAGPGSRAWDLANVAYSWVPLNPRATTPSLAAKGARFARFCDAYGEGIHDRTCSRHSSVSSRCRPTSSRPRRTPAISALRNSSSGTSQSVAAKTLPCWPISGTRSWERPSASSTSVQLSEPSVYTRVNRRKRAGRRAT